MKLFLLCIFTTVTLHAMQDEESPLLSLSPRKKLRLSEYIQDNLSVFSADLEEWGMTYQFAKRYPEQTQKFDLVIEIPNKVEESDLVFVYTSSAFDNFAMQGQGVSDLEKFLILYALARNGKNTTSTVLKHSAKAAGAVGALVFGVGASMGWLSYEDYYQQAGIACMIAGTSLSCLCAPALSAVRIYKDRAHGRRALQRACDYLSPVQLDGAQRSYLQLHENAPNTHKAIFTALGEKAAENRRRSSTELLTIN